MKPSGKDELNLGTNVVEELLPHTRPLLLVDRVVEFRDGDQPELKAQKYIGANEPVFEGHFRRFHLWPGIFTQEGLGQSCFLLYWILVVRHRWNEQNGEPDDVLTALRNLELGYRLHPGFNAEMAEFLRAQLPQDGFAMGMSSGVELRFLKPVYGGCRLDYTVRLTHEVQKQARFEVLAAVDGDPVVQGTMTARVDVGLSTAIIDF